MRPSRFIAAVVLALAATLAVDAVVLAGEVPNTGRGIPISQPPAWPSSPYHGQIDAGTGKPIPCRCRFRDQEFMLGDLVCMQTHVGTVLTRCDIFINNTSWIPTDQPCVMSRRAAPISVAGQ